MSLVSDTFTPFDDPRRIPGVSSALAKWLMRLQSAVRMNVPFSASVGASTTLTDQAQAEEFLGGSSGRAIQLLDLTDFSEVRLVARVVTASTSTNTPKIAAKFKATFDATVGNYAILGTSAVEVSLAATGLIASSWVPLAAAAKADVVVCLAGSGGDADKDPVVGSVVLQFR